MDAYSSKREVEKPKRRKSEIRAMLALEARSYANTMEGLAAIIVQTEGRETPAAEALRKGARFIHVLTEEKKS